MQLGFKNIVWHACLVFACFAGWTNPVEAQQTEPAKNASSDVSVVWTQLLSSPSFGSAAVADIDDDGRLEVAFGTYFGDDSVRVLNGEDGSEYWRFNIGNACVDASLRFADLDQDGSLELVVPISNQGWVLAFDAKAGDEKWRYETTPVECTDTPPAIVDFDSDGELEVVYGTFYGNLHAISKTGKRKKVFQPVKNFIQSGPVVRDLNGDGHRDLVCTTFKGDNSVYAVDGKSGDVLWKFEVPGDHLGMYHGPSVGDLHRDGSLDLVFGAYDGRVYCLRASDGEKQWERDTPDSYIMSPTVIADLDDDGKSEVIVASQHMTVLDSDGKTLWTKPCASGGFDSATRGASIADLNGDGRLDVVSLAGTGLLRAFDGMTGELIYDFDAKTVSDQPVSSSSHGVTIADLTGDGKLDVFFVVGATQPTKQGLAICLSGFTGTGQGWYMLRHDPENTGNLATKLDPNLLARIEGLQPAEQAVMSPARKPRFGKSAPKTTVRQPASTRSTANMDAVYQLAKERGIPRSIVEAAKSRSSDFKKHGADGFHAVCLLIETGNHEGTLSSPLLKATWQPGLEKELLKLCERETLPNFGLWAALEGLGHADTDEVRTYLLERLKTERDAGLFMSIASALGELKEKQGVDRVGEQILRFEAGWSGVEPHLLGAINRMDGELAQAWLAKYLQNENATRFQQPLRQIAVRDPKAAAKLASQIISKRNDLDERQQKTLQRYADQE